MVTIKDLKKFGVFKGLDESELAKVAELCRERTFGQGAICFAQGKRAMELHLCRSGGVDIVAEIDGPSGVIEVVVHTAGPGDIFGWSALVGPRDYTASARCAERTEDICIRGTQLLELFEQSPGTGYKVMKNLGTAVSSRLADTRERLTSIIAGQGEA
jgi:CRP-like cAMP-binding protein